MLFVAKRRIGSGAQFDETTQEPQQVGQTIQVNNDLGVDVFSRFSKPDHTPFCASADRTRNVVGSRCRMLSWDGPVRKNAFDCLNSMYLICKAVDHFLSNGWLAFL